MNDQENSNNPDSSSEYRFGAPAADPGVSAREADLIGHVISVEGSLGAARLADSKVHAESLQIGSMVKMRTAESTVYGMIKGLDVRELADRPEDAEIRVMEFEMVGEAVPAPEGGSIEFRRGVSVSPTLGDGVFAVTAGDLKQVYARPNVSSAKVGTIYQDKSLSAFVSIDDLLGKHFAVLGTTGSGKSCTVATMLRAILSEHREGHVLLLDLHDEYGQAFSDLAEIVSAGQFKLPYWLLNFEELQEIVVEKTENWEVDRAILRDGVVHAKRVFNEGEEEVELFDADSPVHYRMSEVLHFLNTNLGKLDKPTDSAPFLRLRNRITKLIADRRFEFMFQVRFSEEENMEVILSRLFRVPAEGKPITILNLSEVPTDIMKVVISLLCRMTFDFAYWGDRSTPVLLVCEEAHRYSAQLDGAGFDLTRNALSRIVNEGRKYGVSLGIISQRPSELDMGILSQCSTIFAMRMSNLKDQEFVRGTMTESALGLTDALPSLRTGEAVVVGEGVSLPMRVYFDLLPEAQRPRSSTVEFSNSWKLAEGKEGAVASIVKRWRRQRR